MEDEFKSWSHWLGGSIAKRQEADRLRTLSPIAALDAVRFTRDGRRLVLFSSNDYLGLSCHPAIRRAAAEAAQRWGMGPRGSALVCGYGELHRALEEDLARLKGAESALLFPTGYAANCGTLAALASRDLAVFSDELNHASIIDGCRLAAKSGAEISIYRHADLHHLESLLQVSTHRRKLIVTDSLFSMGGDLAPLREIVELKDRSGAWLMVDEAHATLVLGEKGGGWAEASEVEDRIEIQVGTLSKAFGTQGGFVACRRDLCQWLINASRPFVFSTALPLPIVAAAREALAVRRREPRLVKTLMGSVRRLADRLGLVGESPILPLILGDEQSALVASEALEAVGLWVPAIRPPTVPHGTARLRITLSAAHTEEEIDSLASHLEALTTCLPF